MSSFWEWLFRSKKKPMVPVDPKPRDLHEIIRGSRLQRDLDDICLKHHGMLPYENDDDIDW